MIGALKRAYEGFRGFGDYAFSVPPLDGAFLANSDLDDAAILAAVEHPDNLAASGGDLYLSSGGDLLKVEAEGGLRTVESGPRAITALAASKDGDLAIAREGGAIGLVQPGGARIEIGAPRPGSDVTAMAFLSDGSLAVAIGARDRKASDWQVDLMLRGRSGSLWIIDRDRKASQLADGLAYPLGIAEHRDGSLVVSAAWSHALIRVERNGATRPILSDLPGYPARIVPAEGGGYWLSFLSIRNQLVEFVLREKSYVRRMMAEIDREFWICPALRPPASPAAVMQAGAERHHGEMKPWAPSMSYGLIARISAALLPETSLHSRADGNRHGITSLAEVGGALFATSHSAAGVFRVPFEEAGQ